MSDVFRLPYNLPQNSHDWDEGTTSTDEWNAMTHSQYEYRPQKIDPASGQVIQEEGYYPINASYELAQAQQYQTLTHQGRIRICNGFNGFEEFLDPKTVYNGHGFKTPSYDTKHDLVIYPDNHEYVVGNSLIDIRLWDSEKESPSGEGKFITLAVSDIGDVAYKAMLDYLGFLSDTQGEAFKASGAKKTEKGVVIEDSTDVKPDAEGIFRRNLVDAKAAKKDSVEFVFDSSILEPILGKGTLQECFFSLVRYGYFKNASKVDIAGLKVTFSTKAAEDFLLQLFGQKQLEAYLSRGTDLENVADYTGPTAASIQFYYYGGSPKTYDDDVMESMAVYRARENAFTTPVETDYDYAAAAAAKDMMFGMVKDEYKAHTLYLPVLYNAKTEQVEVVTGPLAQLQDGTSFIDAAWFKDNSTVTDGFNLPPGYRLPTEEELVGFRENSDGDVIYTPQGTLYAETGLSIVNDENMFVLNTTANSNIMPLLAVAQFYQPVTETQLATDKEFYTNYNNVDDTFSEIWLTYDQASALGALVVAARSELGAEMAMRRRSDLGFKYEYFGLNEPIGNISDIPSPIGFPFFDVNLPGGAVDGAAELADIERKKVASYAIKFGPGIFAGAITRIQKILDETSGDTIEIEGFSMTRLQAEELIDALHGAERGMWEQMGKWYTKNADGLLGGVFNAFAGAIGFGFVIVLGRALAVKYSPWFRSLFKNEMAEAAKGQSEGVQDRHGDLTTQGKTVEQLAPNLMTERTNTEHEIVGRTNETRQILRYFALKKKQRRNEQFGTLHGAGGTGKTNAMYPVIADTLRLKVYPDGSPVEPWILETFDEVRVFDMADAYAGKIYSNEADGYVSQVLKYQEKHPKCLLVIDEAKDVGTLGATPTDPTGVLNRQFKTLNGQAILFGLATEDVPDFLVGLNKNPGQWKRRLTPVLNSGSWTNGLQDQKPYEVVEVLNRISDSQIADYRDIHHVDLLAMSPDVFRSIVLAASQRYPSGDPSRSIEELSSYLNHISVEGELRKSRGEPPLVPTVAHFQQYVANNPTGSEDEVTAMIAAGRRKPIVDADFNNPNAQETALWAARRTRVRAAQQAVGNGGGSTPAPTPSPSAPPSPTTGPGPTLFTSPAPGIPPGGLLAISVNPGETAQEAGTRVVGQTFLALSHGYGLVNNPRTYADTEQLLDAWFKKITELYNQENPTQTITVDQLLGAYNDILAKEDSEDDAAYLLRMRNFMNDLIAIQQDTDIVDAKADPAKLRRVATLMEQTIDRHYGIKAVTAPSVQVRTHQKHRQAVLAYVDVVMNKLQLVNPTGRPVPDTGLFADLAEVLADEYNARHVGQPQITKEQMVALLQLMFHAHDQENPADYEKRLDAIIADFMAAASRAGLTTPGATMSKAPMITDVLNIIQKHYTASPNSRLPGALQMQTSTTAAAAPPTATPAPVVVAADPTTGISDDPIAELRTILEKYGLDYTRFDHPDVAREFFLIFNIANARIYVGNTNNERERLLKQALQKASLVDADTNKPSDMKKAEIEEIFVRAALEAGRMLTVDTFSRAVRGTKIEAYARSKGWPEVNPLKDSEILDRELHAVLQKYRLDHDVAELNATVYVEEPKLKQRLDILQAALAEIDVIDKLTLAPEAKQLRIKDALMRAMLAAGKTMPDFDITTTPKLNAYAAEQGWPEAVNAAKSIITDVNAFFSQNSQSGTVRQYAKQQYEDLEMRHKIKMPDADPQAVLLFAQVETTHNKVNANTATHIHFKIDEYAFKLVVLRAYAQYMNNTQFLSKNDDEKLAQAQAEFAKTLRTTKGFATQKPGSTPEDARSDLDKNLAALAKIMAENMVALSNQARSRH